MNTQAQEIIQHAASLGGQLIHDDHLGRITIAFENLSGNKFREWLDEYGHHHSRTPIKTYDTDYFRFHFHPNEY